MAADIEINGVDPSTYGWTARDPGALLGSPPIGFDPIALPDRPGARAGLRTTGVRAFAVSGLLESTSLTLAQQRLDNLMALCLKAQPSTVIFAWSTARRLSCECQGVQAQPLGPAFGLFKYTVTLNFSAPDPPFWEGTTEHSVGSVGSTGVLLPMGDAPVYPQISVQGPATNPKVTLYTSTGGSAETITFDVALDSSQFLNVDMDLQTAYVSTSASMTAGTNQIAAWSSGDFFAVLPEYYGYQASSWPMLGVSTGTATATYRKAWY